MKLVILLTCFISIAVQAGEVTINGVRYEKEILYENQSYLHRLAMDYKTNDLYFNYVQENVAIYYSAKLNVNTKEFKEIEDSHGSLGAAIDPKTHDVYIGGLDGIYKYNESNNHSTTHVVRTNGKDWTTWNMFLKNNILYFITMPSFYLYTFVNGQSARFADIPFEIHNFVIDKEDVMYFSYYTQFYKQKKGTNDCLEINDGPYVRALNTDKYGNVYVCSNDGIYKAIGHSDQFIKVVDNVDPISIAFDNDNNMIYSENRKIIRLKPKVT